MEWNFFDVWDPVGDVKDSNVPLIFGWRNWLGKHSSNIWNMVLACLMWLIWQECNNHTFDIVRSTDLLKPILVGTLFQWVRIWGFTQHSSIFDFLLSVRSLFELFVFVLSIECLPSWTRCPFYAINLWLCIKKKKNWWRGTLSRYETVGPPLRGKTIDAYTPQLSRHWVNCEMPQLRVELETFGFTVSPNTSLPLRHSGWRHLSI